MAITPSGRRDSELRQALAACRSHLIAAVVFSFGINLLYLALPLYMLQVYDRVLSSGSVPTLLMLTIAVCLALATLAGLDAVRSRILGRASVRLDGLLAGRVMNAMVERASFTRVTDHAQLLRDFDAYRGFVGGPAILTLLDAPWAVIYVIVTFMLHPLLGVFALVSAVLLIGLAIVNELLTRKPFAEASDAAMRNYAFTEASLRNAEVIQGMGMMRGLLRRWNQDRDRMLTASTIGTDRNTALGSLMKFLRLFMQSAMLGLGAWLAIERSITPGMMFAGTILLARAMQPIETLVGVWRTLIAARAAYQRLRRMLSEWPPRAAVTELPQPRGQVSVESLVYGVPGMPKPVLQAINFSLAPGESLGIFGPTAAGKSTLARLIVGVIAPSSGAVRLDGAAVIAWGREQFGRHVGYLPQDIELFTGTVAENIARFEDAADSEVVKAAQAADAHEMIVRMPRGYETQVGEGGVMLSGGQRQRIALARALFGSPSLVVLDEPNSNLDAEGDAALAKCLEHLKLAGATVILISHRTSALGAVDKLLLLQNGVMAAFGPRSEVMARLNRGASGPAGVAAAAPVAGGGFIGPWR